MICLDLWGNFVEAEICLSEGFKRMEIFPLSFILATKWSIRLNTTSGCLQITTTSRTETIKSMQPCCKELFVSKKHQILWSRMIASLAFRKLCWFASLLRRQQKIKTCREQQFCVHFKLPPQLPENEDLLHSSYFSFYFTCRPHGNNERLLPNRLRLHYSSTSGNRE